MCLRKNKAEKLETIFRKMLSGEKGIPNSTGCSKAVLERTSIAVSKKGKAAANNAVAFLKGLDKEKQSKSKLTKETNDIGNRKAIGQKKNSTQIQVFKKGLGSKSSRQAKEKPCKSKINSDNGTGI